MIRDRICFLNRSGTLFHLNSLGNDFNCLVIEYADSMQEAMQNRFEDGNLYYMDEMNEDEMFDAMVSEIEES